MKVLVVKRKEVKEETKEMASQWSIQDRMLEIKPNRIVITMQVNGLKLALKPGACHIGLKTLTY